MTKVAIQGISGSYSEEAVSRIFGSEVEMLECGSFAEVFRAITEETVTCAVVPVRNSIAGEIEPVNTMLNDGRFVVKDELALRVDHVLAGTNDANITELTSVRSHTEALRQCGRFLDSWPQIRRLLGADTASSIKQVVGDDDPRNAAIGSRRAAQIYGAQILCENVADQPNNTTTFYLISSK
jgi:prephenate dehydratase